MLPDPERSLVQQWLDAGHQIAVVRFGVSGNPWHFRTVARSAGSWGNFCRHGAAHIETAAMPFIADGRLTASQARVGVVWGVLRERGPLPRTQLCEVLELHRNSVQPVIVALREIGAVLTVSEGRVVRHQAIGQQPHWQMFLRARAA